MMKRFTNKRMAKLAPKTRLGVENLEGRDCMSANLTINMFGKAGKDTLTATLGEVDDDAVVSITSNLGVGDDVAEVRLTDDRGSFCGATVKVNFQASNFDLLDGSDRYKVIVDAGVEAGDDATLDVTMNSGRGSEALELIFAGELDGLLKVRMDGGAGADVVRANLSDLDGDRSEGQLDAVVRGGAGNDVVELLITSDLDNDFHIIRDDVLQDWGRTAKKPRGPSSGLFSLMVRIQ